MKEMYSQNHNAVIFEMVYLVTLPISPKNRAITDNYQFWCIIKNFLYKER